MGADTGEQIYRVRIERNASNAINYVTSPSRRKKLLLFSWYLFQQHWFSWSSKSSLRLNIKHKWDERAGGGSAYIIGWISGACESRLIAALRRRFVTESTGIDWRARGSFREWFDRTTETGILSIDSGASGHYTDHWSLSLFTDHSYRWSVSQLSVVGPRLLPPNQLTYKDVYPYSPHACGIIALATNSSASSCIACLGSVGCAGARKLGSIKEAWIIASV